MPFIKGMFGSKVIAQDNIKEDSVRKQRRQDDPLCQIHISCKIPLIRYQMGSMDLFNFGEELDKIKLISYEQVLKLEGEFTDNYSSFKY
jgi:hypothetical protein